MATQIQQLHFVLLPLMAPGHMNPMVDIAKLLASRGIIVTIITTPLNAIRIANTVDRAVQSGLEIRLVQVPFPSVTAGLPEGCENFDMLPSLSTLKKFLEAAEMLQQPVEDLVAAVSPQPSCIISDISFWWTNQIAERFQIPRLVFHGTGCFALHCTSILMSSKIFSDVKSDSEYFVVPDLPHKIELTKAQLPGFVNPSISGVNSMQDKMKEAEKNSFGIVVNTFEALEKDYITEFRQITKQRVWCIGPVSACNSDNLDKAERGHHKASIDQHDCLRWLELQEPNSVIYVCLGSLSRLSTAQMVELALGLETSGKPFIWAIRHKSADLEKWLHEEKFEERIKDRGLLLHGWAPQVLILSHQTIGAFLTHCGWNSTLEGISAGIPLITWPIAGEQFCNEKLIVNVLQVGVKIGVELPVRFGEEETVKVQVKQNQIKSVIGELMSEKEAAKQIRGRARNFKSEAKKAMEEGGSSHISMTTLIQDLMEYAHAIEDES
ncbi:OLC1v1034429C1 [Oldenlandia corymbosa var. corymbosa]|uniref:Glycosyltransferase n=1 Tax=Oldenlandia corymbosa var. corymbosa TaxID=529605 RepID=A0AAV1CRD8_OLDCO|nr:OLC1v1034429C1 [Oldenlandia corymbosa var. corymbosa]